MIHYMHALLALTHTANFMLNFAAGSSSQLRCGSQLSCSTTMPGCPGWNGLSMSAPEPTIFRVTIGLSGGIRGYQSITGNTCECYMH